MHIQRHLEYLVTFLIFWVLSLVSNTFEALLQIDALEEKSFVPRSIIRSHLFCCCHKLWTKNNIHKNTSQFPQSILSSGLLSALYHSPRVTFLCLFWCWTEPCSSTLRMQVCQVQAGMSNLPTNLGYHDWLESNFTTLAFKTDVHF